jgi:GntR family transcriptional regulator/MocR family aminotransferase
MEPLFELSLSAAPERSREVAATLYEQLRSGILEGRLKAGSKLPSTRSAPRLFGVSRNTAQDVYDRLRSEGLVSGRHGSGTYVADPLPLSTASESASRSDAPDPRLNQLWLSPEASSWIGFWRERNEGPAFDVPQIDLRPALVDPNLFPFAAFRQVMGRQLRRLETRPAAFKSPQGNQGNFHFRHAIADHVSVARAVACAAEDVLVTSGAQQAFDLIARALIKPGETVVAVEDPGYPPMRVPFVAAGAQLAPVRVDSKGLIVSEIPSDARIVCVCPSHQFPLGMSMTSDRRRELLQFAARTGAVIVEDDYDGEFRHAGTPLEALRTAASEDQVFYVGSFSKCMLPSLRLGFVIPPRWAMATLIAAKNALDWHCPVPLQMAVAEFIAKGRLSGHVRRLRRIYRERHDHLLATLREMLGNRFQPIPSSYGMHIAAVTNDELDCEAVSDALVQKGIQIHALNRYFLGPADRTGFVLGYASVDVSGLTVAIEALAYELEYAADRSVVALRDVSL